MPTEANHIGEAELAAWVNDELSPEESRVVEDHLTQCNECARQLDSYDSQKNTFLDQVRCSSDTSRDTGMRVRSQRYMSQARAWVGETLGRYRVTSALGAGGMGIVLEAQDTAIGRMVALKVLHEELANDTARLQRFVSEARAAGKLHHPNVLTLFDIAQAGGVHFLVMELAEQGSANDLLTRQGAIAPEQATEIIIQAAQGLMAAHEVGLIHRDLKPANLLINNDDIIKVADFGVAKCAEEGSLKLTKQGQIVGTPHFMSPEQCAGRKVDVRSDIYSLGATYFSLLAGEIPYADSDSLVAIIHAHCFADRPDPRKSVASVPSACAAIVERAMAIEPEARYQTVAEMLEDLRACTVQSTLPEKVRPAEKSDKRLTRRAAIAAGVAAGGGLVGAAYWGLWGGQGSPAQPGAVLPGGTADRVKIGFLHSLSGTMRQPEQVIVDALRLSADELNDEGGVLGHKIDYKIVDGRSDEEMFAKQAKYLIDEWNAATIFGCFTSASRKMVAPVVESRDNLLMYSLNTEGLETSPNIMYLGGDPTQTIVPCLGWAYVTQKSRQFYLIGSDYVFPRVVNEIVKDELEQLGGKVVGENYLPLGTTEVRTLLDDIELSGADTIINTISGDSQTAFLRDMQSRGMELVQLATGLGEEEVRNADFYRDARDFSVSTYFQSIYTPENLDFIERFRSRYGPQRLVNDAMHTSYAAVKLWAKAATEAGSFEPTAIRDAMRIMSVKAPGGVIGINSETQYAYRRPIIGRVSKTGQFELEYRSVRTKDPTPFPETRSKQQWLDLLEGLHQQWGGRWSAPPRKRPSRSSVESFPEAPSVAGAEAQSAPDTTEPLE
ncbi:transporter substrate-binding protein [Aeoliella sp. ICT_H6.2]|uniref:non-specific serine/threonine protein kinase n=1 Tax=Aeoliella straminimaris TaxID=2954799 RepID=A0A9X2F5L3_9BACT|nr:bifunctional serine/threonine-protein kinase/ABC transporter substrate-binding protein [Aeoliella straminimaris]MCO6042635.1 transporter substrate-binding protein [Aeoliella straminimaris]